MFFFCKQKTAYELRISDWSSDVCSSDLTLAVLARADAGHRAVLRRAVLRRDFLVAVGVVIRRDQDHQLARQRLEVARHQPAREGSEERRVGKECVSTCSSG